MHPELGKAFEEVLTKVRGYLPDPDTDLLARALTFSERSHEGQTRKSGEDYIFHPVAVAGIVADLRMDEYSLCAALLHDTVEDTAATLADLREEFGEQIALLVEALTKISKLRFKSREEHQAENIRKLIIAMSRDLRVVLIKLADRLHNMRTLSHMSEAGQRRIAQETLEIYAPLANRLGIHWVKSELEDLSFRYLEPEAYRKLSERIAKTRAERESYIRETTSLLRQILRDKDLRAEVHGRPKHFYSIWRKMKRREVDFEQIHDLTAFRVIVDSKDDCYEALGVVHALWRPVPGRFKDYIGLPKPNGYQSLHTTVIGPKGERIEIQIRTQEMHRVAEQGIAAHWVYKEGGSVPDSAEDAFAWMRELMETHVGARDSLEFIDSLKLDLFTDFVFVFTPRGDIKRLPQGSTPVDFAYSIHSEVGHHCALARVNGRVVSLRYQLKNGDEVEIETRADQHPREEWLEFVRSGGARAKIRHYVHAERREKTRATGRELLAAELRKHNEKLDSLLKKGKLDGVVQELNHQTPDQLFLALGAGKIRPETIVKKVLPDATEKREEKPTGPVARIGERIRALVAGNQKPAVRVAGLDGDMLVNFARCCAPVPDEPIVGYVTRGRGVTVHAKDCDRIDYLEPERQIEVDWDSPKKRLEGTTHRARIRVLCDDRAGMLVKLSEKISAQGVNISRADCRTHEGGATCNFHVQVSHVDQLQTVMASLRDIEGVDRVERL